MLIYSYEKEFIGIDEEYLNIFGFSDLAALQKKHKDFADFFVKRPGYIHNFKHVHWIDFIDCAESLEESKVMINIQDKSFTANIELSTIYLSQSPNSKSFIVKFHNLKQLLKDAGDAILIDIAEDEPPVQVEEELYIQPEIEEIIVPEVEEKSYESVASVEVTPPDYDLPLEIDILEEPKEVEVNTEVPRAQNVKDVIAQDTYVFDPKIASDELGLPVDLIEEFIQDFIAQAREFEAQINKALSEGDIETVAMLSHKLKGVAGNLQIENAYDKLCIINESKSLPVIKSNLDDFYNIIAQLAGEKETPSITEEVPPSSPTEVTIVKEHQKIDTPVEGDLYDDDFILEFKDEENAAELIPLELEAEEELERDIVVTYSKKIVANEIGLDMETFDELLQDYVQESFVLLEDMKEAINLDDIEKCRKKAFILKNMSDSMYIKDLTSDLTSLVTDSDKNSILAAIDNVYAIIKQISK